MKHILLIEDARDLAQAVRLELENEGFRVVQAYDGAAALELFASQQPDLVILDWMLPRLDGIEVLRQIRKGSPVPILMLTARAGEIDRIVGLEVGADDYLTKPFSMRELIARVRALLRRIERVREIVESDRAASQACVSCGPLHLDPAALSVSVDGSDTELTRTEFQLLHLLARNPGTVFSRAYLLETVWGENYIAGDRSVDSAIMRLRKKLGAAGDLVETVWGVGYRLRAQDG